jgi:DNA-directed RNA polymerase specialized sigma24 family protein
MQQEIDKQQQKFIQNVIQTAIETERQIQRNQILHNTRILMEQYIEMRKHCENAVSESDDLDSVEFAIFKSDNENTYLESVRRSKLKTAMMLTNIDRAMDEIKEEYEKKGMLYKYEAFRMHYVDGMSYEEVAEVQNCGKNTPARWSKEIIRKMSVKLFGVEGVEKW